MIYGNQKVDGLDNVTIVQLGGNTVNIKIASYPNMCHVMLTPIEEPQKPESSCNGVLISIGSVEAAMTLITAISTAANNMSIKAASESDSSKSHSPQASEPNKENGVDQPEEETI